MQALLGAQRVGGARQAVTGGLDVRGRVRAPGQLHQPLGRRRPGPVAGGRPCRPGARAMAGWPAPAGSRWPGPVAQWWHSRPSCGGGGHGIGRGPAPRPRAGASQTVVAPGRDQRQARAGPVGRARWWRRGLRDGSSVRQPGQPRDRRRDGGRAAPHQRGCGREAGGAGHDGVGH